MIESELQQLCAAWTCTSSGWMFSRDTDNTSGLHRQVRSSYQCAASLLGLISKATGAACINDFKATEVDRSDSYRHPCVICSSLQRPLALIQVSAIIFSGSCNLSLSYQHNLTQWQISHMAALPFKAQATVACISHDMQVATWVFAESAVVILVYF